jgi:hypothetical protein
VVLAETRGNPGTDGTLFTDSALVYDGGVVNLGDTNKVVNSVLVIGPHAQPESETARRLMKAFSWSRILRAMPSGKS